VNERPETRQRETKEDEAKKRDIATCLCVCTGRSVCGESSQ